VFKTRRRKLALISIVGVFAAVGAGVAAWLLTVDSVSGVGGIATVTAPTVSFPATANYDIYPGDTGDAKITVNNPNTKALTLTSVSYSGGTLGVFLSGGGVNNACDAATYTSITPSITGLSINIPVGTSTVLIPGVFHLAANAPTACMGSSISYSGSNSHYTFST
jgi:hypothetical protein